jgi:acyl carrier protein
MSDAARGPDRLRMTLAGVLDMPADEITDTISPQTAETWDSLNHLNLVMALEEEFAVSLSVDDALEMRSVAAIRGVLARRGVQC